MNAVVVFDVLLEFRQVSFNQSAAVATTLLGGWTVGFIVIVEGSLLYHSLPFSSSLTLLWRLAFVGGVSPSIAACRS